MVFVGVDIESALRGQKVLAGQSSATAGFVIYTHNLIGITAVAIENAACQLLNKAAEGDLSAIKELADRLDGKAIQSNAMTAQLESSMPRNIQVRFMQPDPIGKPLVIDSN